MQNEFELKTDHSELICDIQFSPIDNKFLSSSFDNTINIYNCENWEQIQKIRVDSPQISTIFDPRDSNTCYSAGYSSEITQYNLTNLTKATVGQHLSPIPKIIIDSNDGTIYSVSWDKTFKSWDCRLDNPLVYSNKQDDKIHNICQTSNYLLINVGLNRVKIFDKRNLKESIDIFTMNFNINSLNSYRETNFILGSLEGKISVEAINRGNSFGFKCHRVEKEEEITAYPINCIVAHPNKEIFASGGSDRLLYLWDYDKKKKIWKSKEHNASVNNCIFNKSGSFLAISTGNICTEDEELNK